jgi:hypothetical protein
LLLVLVLILVGGAGAATSGPHKSLDAAVGKCRILGGGSAFYVCPPFAGALPLGEGSVSASVHWTLLGNAASSNGRSSFDDTHGVVQVVLRNGWPFGANSGVRVTGHVAPRSLVFASFWPAPVLGLGYAVWQLPKGAANLRFETGKGGRTASLIADGQRLAPTLVIPPATVLRSQSLAGLFKSDMERLAAIADGKPAGACNFYAPRLHMSDDNQCAQAIGLSGKAAAVRASVASARFWSYNGWTLGGATVGGQQLAWVLDGGHFRFTYGYRLA